MSTALNKSVAVASATSTIYSDPSGVAAFSANRTVNAGGFTLAFSNLTGYTVDLPSNGDINLTTGSGKIYLNSVGKVYLGDSNVSGYIPTVSTTATSVVVRLTTGELQTRVVADNLLKSSATILTGGGVLTANSGVNGSVSLTPTYGVGFAGLTYFNVSATNLDISSTVGGSVKVKSLGGTVELDASSGGVIKLTSPPNTDNNATLMVMREAGTGNLLLRDVNSLSAVAGVTIYNQDGHILADRTVYVDNNLTFSGSIKNVSFALGTGNFSVSGLQTSISASSTTTPAIATFGSNVNQASSSNGSITSVTSAVTNATQSGNATTSLASTNQGTGAAVVNVTATATLANASTLTIDALTNNGASNSYLKSRSTGTTGSATVTIIADNSGTSTNISTVDITASNTAAGADSLVRITSRALSFVGLNSASATRGIFFSGGIPADPGDDNTLVLTINGSNKLETRTASSLGGGGSSSGINITAILGGTSYADTLAEFPVIGGSQAKYYIDLDADLITSVLSGPPTVLELVDPSSSVNAKILKATGPSGSFGASNQEAIFVLNNIGATKSMTFKDHNGVTITAVPGSRLSFQWAGGSVSTITAASWSSNVVTFTCTNSFSVGNTVVVSGVTPSAYNGSYTVASASGTQFTATLNSNPGSYTSGGYAAKTVGTHNGWYIS